MRTRPPRPFVFLLPLLLGVVLILAGCSISRSGETIGVSTSSGAPPTAATAPAAPPSAAPAPRGGSSRTITGAAAVPADVTTAVKAVVQQANDEQQRAFAA